MSQAGHYDGTLQMFVEAPRTPVLARLEFLRWLAERQALEHPVAGLPGGIYAQLTPRPVGPPDCPTASWSNDGAGPGRAAEPLSRGISSATRKSWRNRWPDPAEQW